jgi:hypothetical protein
VVGNNPDCGPDGLYCNKPTDRGEQYDFLLDKGIIEKLPDQSTIYDPRYNTSDRVTDVLANYEAARRELFIRYGFDALESSGKIKDEIFLALIIAAEFGIEINNPASFNEAVEALSNQYHSNRRNPGPMRCRGSCTLQQQLLWATQMQGWYSTSFMKQAVLNGSWIRHRSAALGAMNGYSYGEDTSWFWGNVSDADLARFKNTYKRKTEVYPGKPWWIIYE